jgi:hypothetical protein
VAGSGSPPTGAGRRGGGAPGAPGRTGPRGRVYFSLGAPRARGCPARVCGRFTMRKGSALPHATVGTFQRTHVHVGAGTRKDSSARLIVTHQCAKVENRAGVAQLRTHTQCRCGGRLTGS